MRAKRSHGRTFWACCPNAIKIGRAVPCAPPQVQTRSNFYVLGRFIGAHGTARPTLLPSFHVGPPFLLCLIFSLAVVAHGAPRKEVSPVSLGTNGKLVYQ